MVEAGCGVLSGRVPPAAVTELLRPGLLEGIAVVVASADPPSRFGEAVNARCADLRAGLGRVAVDPTGGEVEPQEADVVVWDGASLAGPRDVLDGAWLALRPLSRAWIDGGQPGGKLLLIAPPPSDAGAEASRAGLENLARTLSIEWSQYGIRTAALLPGEATGPAEVAELAAFLASRAGDYYSGCHFRMGAT
jgi:hypothetical protein